MKTKQGLFVVKDRSGNLAQICTECRDKIPKDAVLIDIKPEGKCSLCSRFKKYETANGYRSGA